MVPKIVHNHVLNRRIQFMLDSNYISLRILYVLGILLFSAICLGLSFVFARQKWSQLKQMEAPNARTTLTGL